MYKRQPYKDTKIPVAQFTAEGGYYFKILSDARKTVSYTHLDVYKRQELAQRDIKVEKSDFNIDNMLTTMRQY